MAKLKICIVQSNNGCWGYCPESARALLKPELDDEASFETAADALKGAQTDVTIPKDVLFVVEPPRVKAALKKRRVQMHCANCGGTKVQADAYASWDLDAQEWVLDAMFDKGAVCEDCDGETRIEERPIVRPVSTAPSPRPA